MGKKVSEKERYLNLMIVDEFMEALGMTEYEAGIAEVDDLTVEETEKLFSLFVGKTFKVVSAEVVGDNEIALKVVEG